MESNIAYTAGEKYSTNSIPDNKSNTRQGLAKNECAKKRFAILAIVAFVLSLLVAVAALVYTNIELKNQMSSTNKQIQSMNDQLNNQSSQQIQNLQAQLSDLILLLQTNFSEQLSSTNNYNKQVQSMNEQLNNQSSQLSNSILALSGNISEQNKNIFWDLKDVRSILEKFLYLGTINNPANSCSDIPQDRPSGKYWIATTTSSPVRVYCDMNRTSCSCNTTGEWMRVANLDMTDPNQNCPEGLRLETRTEPPLRTCGQVEGPAGCTSTTYSTHGVEYSNVCGRIIAYQRNTPDAFYPYSSNAFSNIAVSIDDVYVEGVSLPMVGRLVSISGHLLMQSMKL